MLSESQWYTQMSEGEGVQDYYGNVLSPYLIPEYNQPHPWNRGSACDKDFVLISEFCEQEGPKPLITIPTDEGSKFDKNEFVVRIMAVDHQTSSSGFSLIEDTQVVMTELRNGTYAYVHHFTLFDHQARGFVRPFCMTYVTADSRKIMSFYEDLSSEFNKVSRFFKYGNKKVFAKDLENHLKDLKYTRERVVAVQCELSEKGQVTLLPEEAFLRETTVETMDQAIQEVQDILAQIRPQLNDQRLEERFKRLEQKALSSRNQREADLFESTSLREEALHPKSADSTRQCGSYSGSFHIDDPLFSDTTNHKVKLVQLGRRRFEESLRGLHELCQWGAKEGLNRLRSIHKYFSRDSAILEIEKNESPLIDPPCSLLTIGRCVANNFLHDIDLQCAGACWSLGSCNRDQRLFHPTNNLLRRWVSNDTLDSYKSLDSFLSAQDDEAMISAKSSYEPTFIMASARMGVSGMDDSYNSSYSDWVDIPFPSPQPANSIVSDNLATPAVSEDPPTDNQGTPTDSYDTLTAGSESSLMNSLTLSDNKQTKLPELDMTDSALGASTIDTRISDAEIVNDIDSISRSQLDNSSTKSDHLEARSNALQTKSYSFQKEAETKLNIVDHESPLSIQIPSLAASQTKSLENKIKEENILQGGIIQEHSIQTLQIKGNVDVNDEDGQAVNGLKRSTDSGIEGEAKDSPCVGGSNGFSCEAQSTSEEEQCPDYNTDSPLKHPSYKGKSLLSVNVRPNTALFVERINRPDEASVDSTSDIDDAITAASDAVRKRKVAVFSAADHVCQMSSVSPGYNILRLCQLYGRLDGVVYSLLCGRPVVVVGSQRYEHEIRDVVTSLKLFLPGYASTMESVNPLHHKPLRLADMTRYRLIGLCRPDRRSLDYMVPSSVRRYLTLFDIEKRYTISPAYQGRYVNLLLSHVNQFKSDESFIAYLHSVLLEISSEAYVYYHMFCLNSTACRKRSSTLSVQCSSHRKAAAGILHKLGINDCDVHIIEHLVDLISCQQVEHFFNKNDLEPEFTSPCLTLSKEICQTQRC